MKNHALLAGAAFMLFGTAAIAQDMPAPDAGMPADAAPTAPAMPDATMPATPDAGAPDVGSTPMPAPPSAPEASAPADAASTAAGVPSATSSGAPADPAKAQAAEQMISQNWAKYDPDNKGSLSPLQFGEWVMAAQGRDMSAQINKSRTGKGAGLPATKVLNATSAEFGRADKNGDRMISREELLAYLTA